MHNKMISQQPGIDFSKSTFNRYSTTIYKNGPEKGAMRTAR